MADKKQDDILRNLPSSAADFIRLVIKKMRYRKGIRRDVMNELAAHFEDELKDCKTGEEKNLKVKRLIEEFGDPKLLGILLRRAKKRCRPLWRTIVVRSFQTVGILIISLIAYTVWFLTGKPVITNDYVAEFNRIARPVADETQNAFPIYGKAIQFLKSSSDFNDIKAVLGWRYYERTAEEREKASKWIARNKEVFDLFIAGNQKPYYWQTYKIEDPNLGMMGIQFSQLAEFRTLAFLLFWRAEFFAEQGRFEDAFGDLTVCYSFGRHLKQGNFLIEQLVSNAIEAKSVSTVCDILNTYPIDSIALKTLQENFERAITDENFAINLTGVKWCGYDAIQRLFTDDSITGGHLCLGGLSTLIALTDFNSPRSSTDVMLQQFLPRAPYILFFHPNKKETKFMLERYYDFWERCSQKTPAQIHAEKIDMDKEALHIVKGNLLIEKIVPVFGKMFEISNHVKIKAQAVIASVAVLRYKQDKGRYPESLDDLITSGFLREMPIDPWSDKPLVYRKTETGFTLYSIGKNFVDDDGVIETDDKGNPKSWAENGDEVFWPVVKIKRAIR